jgi:hypothetical protein
VSRVPRIPQSEHAIERQAEPLRQRVNELDDVNILDGRLLDGVSVTAGRTNRIRHGLQRRLLGFIVVRNAYTVSVSFYDLQATNPRPQDELWLYPETGGTETAKISLWVF